MEPKLPAYSSAVALAAPALLCVSAKQNPSTEASACMQPYCEAQQRLPTLAQCCDLEMGNLGHAPLAAAGRAQSSSTLVHATRVCV
jgi:hypothetical protein